ncbi:MAG TPA: DUF4388 domain-containing protein [Nitrospirota bacterium]|nr:DUF4388 domain-containing protein [Nitrospirota bacterium]
MPTPTGEIRDLTIPWLFQGLRASNKTGTAVFEQDILAKKVYFGNGDILFASSNRDDERLGEFLLKQGRITQAQFDTASATVIRTKKKLGAVLFEAGILSPKDLVTQVKLQVKHIILDLFSWRDGRYRFEEGKPAGDEVIPLQMSTGSLILEGIQGLDWQIIRKGIPPLKTFLRPVLDPSLIFQDAQLSADQRSILALVNGARTIEQLCSLSGIGDFNALKAVYLLLALKMAEVGELKSAAEQRFVHDAVAEAARGAGSAAASPQPPVTKTMILEAFSALKRQDHFEVLGVVRTASPQELKKAYFRLAKMYHPDRHFEPEMADMKETLEAIFYRIHEAYETLTSDERRKEYEQKKETEQTRAAYEEKRADEYVENYAEKMGRAATYFNAGMKEFKAGNFWGAADSFAWATRLDPVKAPYFYYYALSLMRIPRRRHEAEENLRKAIEIDPLKTEYHLDLGNLYLKGGLKAKAMEAFEGGLRANPYAENIIAAIKAAGGDVPKQGGPEGGKLFDKIFKDKK